MLEEKLTRIELSRSIQKDLSEDFTIDDDEASTDDSECENETEENSTDEQEEKGGDVPADIEHQCDFCDFKTVKKFGLTIHAAKKHKHHCVGCSLDFSNELEVGRHFCTQVENFENPCYSKYFIEKRNEEFLCFNIIRRNHKMKTHISTLHTQNCWSNSSLTGSCSELSTISTNNEGHSVLDDEGKLHMLVTNVITGKKVDWDDLYRSFIGFGVD